MDKIFIIEDDSERIKWFLKNFNHCDITVAESVKEGVDKFKPPYSLILLDHDLGGRQYVSSEDRNTGSEFLRYILDGLDPYNFSNVDFVIHSHNPGGAHNMKMQLKAAKRNMVNFDRIYSIPFSNLVEYWNSSRITICGKRKYDE